MTVKFSKKKKKIETLAKILINQGSQDWVQFFRVSIKQRIVLACVPSKKVHLDRHHRNSKYTRVQKRSNHHNLHMKMCCSHIKQEKKSGRLMSMKWHLSEFCTKIVGTVPVLKLLSLPSLPFRLGYVVWKSPKMSHFSILRAKLFVSFQTKVIWILAPILKVLKH